MLRKKFLAVLFAAIFVLQTLCIGASAKTYTIDDLTKMSLYDFYCTFAQAIVDHDYKTVGLFIPNSNDSQFKYSGVTFTGYKVELLKKARGEYEEDGKAAKITFNISKSNNKLFPVGKQEYYVYIDFYGVVGEYNFYPYSQKEKNVSDKYVDLYYASVYAAAFQFNFEDVSEKQLKNIEFTYFFVHSFYHAYLQQDPKYRNGIREAELIRELRKFCNTEKKPSKKVMSCIVKKKNNYFQGCNHGGDVLLTRCNKITKNKKTGDVTLDIWFYSDCARMNVCRKVKMTYSYSGGKYTLKKSDTYYKNKYDIYGYSV